MAAAPAPRIGQGRGAMRPTIQRPPYGVVDQRAKGSARRLNPDPAIEVVHTRTAPSSASGTWGDVKSGVARARMSAISAREAEADSKFPGAPAVV